MIDTPAVLPTSYANRVDDRSTLEEEDFAALGRPDTQESTTGAAAYDRVVCRKLRVRDIRHFASKYRLLHAEMPDSRIERAGPFGIALAGSHPFNRLRPVTHLAFSDNGRFLAFAQFRQTGPDRRWALRALGVANGLSAPEPVVEALLEFSVVRAGSRGVKRLFARLAIDSQIQDSFHRIGFDAYMSEELFELDGRPALARGNGGIREQEQSDTWAVHQLYHAAVPRHVQFAEAWTSHQWDVGNRNRRKGRRRCFLLEDGHQIVAFARLRFGANAATIEIMYLPDRRHDLEGFCAAVVDEAMREGGAGRIFIPVRAYQAELMTILDKIGFRRLGEQDLLIKYTTAKVTAKAAEAVVLAPADARERVATRIPTYFSREREGKTSIWVFKGRLWT